MGAGAGLSAATFDGLRAASILGRFGRSGLAALGPRATAPRCLAPEGMLSGPTAMRVFRIVDDSQSSASPSRPTFPCPPSGSCACSNGLSCSRALPRAIRVDNGPAFTSQAFPSV
jgi:hypothetical protein